MHFLIQTQVKFINLSSLVFICVLSFFSHVWLFVTPWTVICQAPLSTGFSGQDYWSGLPCLQPEDLPDPGIEPRSLISPTLVGGFFTTSATWDAGFLFNWQQSFDVLTTWILLQKLHFLAPPYFFRTESQKSLTAYLPGLRPHFVCWIKHNSQLLGCVFSSVEKRKGWARRNRCTRKKKRWKNVKRSNLEE